MNNNDFLNNVMRDLKVELDDEFDRSDTISARVRLTSFPFITIVMVRMLSERRTLERKAALKSSIDISESIQSTIWSAWFAYFRNTILIMT